mgnify:CR=1 FL=1
MTEAPAAALDTRSRALLVFCAVAVAFAAVDVNKADAADPMVLARA